MRRTRVIVVAVVAALGGAFACGSEDVPRFELDVTVSRTSAGGAYVLVHGIDVAAACPRAVHVPPAAGTCTPVSDVLPPPCGSWRCVSHFRVEVNGATAAAEAAPADFANVGLELPALAAGDQAVLVVEGCGTSARIALPGEPLATPTVTRFAYQDGAHVFEWEGAPGATSASGFVSGGFIGSECRNQSRDAVRVPLSDPYVSVSGFAAIADEGVVETPYGPAHLARLAPAEVPPQEVPHFALDVTVANSGAAGEGATVRVHAIELGADCPMARGAFPPIGACDSISDQVPPPCGSWHCVTRFSAEVNGSALADSGAPDELGDAVVHLPSLAASDTATLVVEGCRTSARIPLPTTLLAPPTVTSVVPVDDGYAFEWEGAPGATSAVASVTSDTVGTFECHSDGVGTAHVTTALLAVSSASLTALVDEGRVETPYGTAQVWRAAESAAPPPGAP